MIIHNRKLRSDIMSALSDVHMQCILQSTAISPKSANEIIKDHDLPHSSTYRKIHELVKFGLLVLYKLEISNGKKIGYYKSSFRSIYVKYEGLAAETIVEAEPNIDALERISQRFFDFSN
jgi:predicted transcriptional regulator